MLLKDQTKQLIQYLDILRDKFEENNPPKHISDKKFFLKMKEETAPIYELLEQWEESALSFVKNREVNVHPHQIISTKENIELILLHSYYIDVRRRRYMEINQSSHYIFEQILREIEKVTNNYAEETDN